MGVETAIIASALVAAAGTGYSVSAQHDAQASADNKARAEKRRLAGITAQRNDNLSRVREAYGIGNSQAAQGNAKTLADSIDQYYHDALTTNLQGVDDQYSSASRTSRQNLARVGQLGSGLDTSSKSGNLADFIRGRQTAVAKAAAARDSLQGRLGSQRLNLESSITAGGANPDFGTIASQQRGLLDQARSEVTPAAVGNLFDVAGASYFGGRQQEAQGNQGLQAFGFTGSNRGRIS